MSTYVYSAYVGNWKPSGASTYKKYRSWLAYDVDITDTQVKITVSSGLEINSSVNATYSHTLSATDYTTSSGSTSTDYQATTRKQVFTSKVFTYDRGTEDRVITISAGTYATKSAWTGRTWAYATLEYTVPALHNFPINYYANGGEGDIVPQTKFYGIDLTLTDETPTREGWAFAWWNTKDDDSGVPFLPEQLFDDNVGREDEGLETERTDLYAQWQAMYPPTCHNNGLRDEEDFARYTKNFSSVSTDVSDIEVHGDRTISSITLKVGSDTSTITEEGTVSVTPTQSGVLACTLTITDSLDASTSYFLGNITVSNPTWTKTVSFTTDMPDIASDGKAIMTVELYNYTLSDWEEISQRFEISGEDGDWSFVIKLTEDYVDGFTDEPSSQTRATYNHSVAYEKDYRSAFYETSRNANYSNGIANSVFVSGCDAINFSSRVWWCYPNNPLYFPDTSYVEVGSNDTSVQGLIKVGDYLGAIKQSKTTDTAIYLLYPTSFDDDTTYAVKQGVQGVGALAKFSFNILGDETLFLSPNGIMAIVPSQDEEHKVQNRSYFIDGKLLTEENIESAYSFVYDGKYWLAVNGNCYVLDGNQRNSWGNDRTNLVYEAYYLENIPATCFMKYGGELWFSDSEYVYRFTNGYEDKTDGDSVAVSCEWSTILDDDGSLHYLKTMQKKGNIVSILPVESGDTSAEVYIKKDAEEPIYVGEVNGQVEETGDIPNELVVRKKIKKYKRLQFIIRNNKAEGLGIDNITKSYVVGNYVKK